jgi:Holliday junction resolvase RusA-like endonuclease
MRTAAFTLSLPPSVNGCFANVPGRGRVHTAQYRAWRKQALASIAAQAHGVTFRGTFRIAVLASDQGLIRGRDADNLGKAIADTLTKAGIIADDCYRHMRVIALVWMPNLPAGTCTVTVDELSPEPIAKPAASPRRAVKRDFPTNTRAPAKQVPASVLAALKRRGINVDASRVHL